MDTHQKTKSAVISVKDRQQLQLLAIIALALMLIITTVVNAFQKDRLIDKYDAAREKLASCVSVQATQFLRTCDSLSTPGANVEGDLLPDLHTYFYAMQETDELLTYTYGSAYKVLPDSLSSQIKLALSAYDQAFSTGKPTNSAFSSLTTCASTLNQVLESRFDENGHIVPAK